MNVFITGATGFIGRAAVLRLQRDGHTLSAWVRDPERARSLLGANIELINASEGPEALRRAVGRAEAVINLAGESILGGRWTQERRRKLVHSRLDLTHQIADAIAEAKRPPRVLLSASAIGIYGDGDDIILDEHSAPASDFLASLCTRWEQAAQAAASEHTRVALLRIGVVLGAGGGAIETMTPFFRMGLGGPMGSGEQYMSWIHIDDMVEILARGLADKRYEGAINCVAPTASRNRTFARTMGDVLSRPAVLPMPGAVLKLLFGAGAQASLVSQRIEPAALRACGFRFRFPELEEALSDILAPADGCVIRPLDQVPNTPDIARSLAFPYLRERKPLYLLEHTSTLDAPLEQVFPFFAEAANLAVLTPPSMSFRILTPQPIEMRPGAVIDYRIALGAVPMRWRTLIERWEPGICFVDAQHRGPYHAWWHEHSFEADGGNTIMRDRVFYAPPLGVLGRLANALFVQRMLEDIFNYRNAAIRLRFGRVDEGARSPVPAPVLRVV
ncbi:TIGR01777 family oxidoreductase [Haliangium ochraceum]|uniref:NAD-dependent epimerase/dehydratase n=1 Tax=Haliangium ochraceum (strain DSM 14365 / JCM 11303 / SMP-2) TaxID=502025 RepID=D0LNP4_HALO1|nr:TIGR01777 family oxidoreductase [Haliangium ochraceum]ACY16949.1 NAD-dependent epimerase/dehydratase [Haliangium ochraceum DSM 14365]